MVKEKEIIQQIPKTIELKDKLIECPKCGTKIQIDLDIDVSFISDLAKSLQEMNKEEGEDE